MISFEEHFEIIWAMIQNAKKIALERQDRRLASEVLVSCTLYVSEVNFPFDYTSLEELASSILDKNNSAIIEEFSVVERKFSTFKANKESSSGFQSFVNML